jgi:signal transduction histidine kinase
LDQRVERVKHSEPEASPHAGSTRLSEHLRALSLSSKLLILTTLFVMLAEVLIFVPSVANFRNGWLMDRLASAQLASLAAEATPSGDVPAKLRAELLRTAQVRAVALKRNDQRLLVLQSEMPVAIDKTYDLTALRHGGLGARLQSIADALGVLASTEDRMLRILGKPADDAGDLIEMVIPEAPLRAAMWRFALNILGLSVIISVFTAALVYMALNSMLVSPMERIARNMVRFAQNPEDRSRIVEPSQRGDEIGTVERELAHMQTELSHLLSQKSRLAALGLAVSKINHDLRNLLANTQLLSDRLTSSPDPTVQRFAPKLMASLDRAIAFCNDTLKYGRAAERPPRRELLALRELVDEVGEGLDLPREGGVGWDLQIPAELMVDADEEHLFRVLNNLVRNAVQALEAQTPDVPGSVKIAASRLGARVRITVSDNGPGVPLKARERLFQAFQSTARKGGTGLGLAIAHELIVAHGGTLELLETTPGATFEIVIPDREKS